MKVRELFDQCATGYDRDRTKLVPGFDEFYGAALGMIPFGADENVRVLDLGAGTGLFAAMLAKILPKASFFLTDISKAMLAEAEKRFAGMPRVTFAVQEHIELSAVAQYDLILSALSIHHLENHEKRMLFDKVFRALRRGGGGVFINADQALGPTLEEEDDYERQWLKAVTASGLPMESVAQARERMREDRNATLDDQLKWLAETGCKKVHCVYRRYRFVVYGGRKT